MRLRALNRGKLLRALVALATFTVVWLVVSPASALPNRAPVCDPRGAVGFAPPPQIQDLELSLDIPADCVELSPLDTKNVVPGRAAAIDFSISQEPLLEAGVAIPTLAFAERLSARRAVEGRPRPGVHARLERPPRA